MKHAIEGLWPALLQPVGADGAVDTPRAIAHARRMLAAGCDGVTLFGTTGEGPAFTLEERQQLLQAMLDNGIGPDQIVVNITTLALGEAVLLGRHALERGVTRQLLMAPFFFNNPPDAGIAEAVSQVVRGIDDKRLRLVLYHFPMMSTSGFSHAVIQTLVERHADQIAGVKDSGADREHALALAKAFPALSVLVGAEMDIAPVMLQGGSGSINGLSNLAPALLRRVVDAPDAVSAEDQKLMADLLALIGLRPEMPFVCAFKTVLAEQTGDDAWLNVRAPLSAPTPEQEGAVRDAYRAIGPALARL